LNTALWICAVFFALCLGSFLNVVIARLPRGESLAFPGSRCPSCRKAIRPYDNIPIVSFLLLRGRCRRCGTAISARYPLVEALTALVLLAILRVYGLSNESIAYGVLALFLIPIAFIDLDTGFILDKLTIPAFIVGIPLVLFLHLATWKGVGIGILAGAGSLTVMALLGRLLFKKEAMGMGDIKLLAVVGVYLGFPSVLIALFLGGFAGFLVILAGLAFKKVRLQDEIPFGPFIAIGTVVQMIIGSALLQWYLGLF
jgi:leader peptidase (prepilin peptidase) / N-methyltransferase